MYQQSSASIPKQHPLEKRPKAWIVNKYGGEYLPSFVHTKIMNSTSVPEALAPYYQDWAPETPVIIDAPTGAGKSTFAGDIILLAMQNNEKVLILSNRNMVSNQQKRRLLEYIGCPKLKLLSDEGLEQETNFDSVYIMTYQAFAVRQKTLDLAPIRWVILDECHYFISDALFNDFSDRLFCDLPRLFGHCRRIYLTATADQILLPLAELEENYAPLSYKMALINNRFVPIRELLHYKFPREFGHLNICCFRDMTEITELIVASDDQKKWLVFVHSRKAGRTLKDKLGECAKYLDSDSKGNATWNKLLKTDRFESKVLICTSVLDCGANIIDDNLVNIVVDTFDKTSMIQMIGRKRCKPDERVNLYIKVPSAAQINCAEALNRSQLEVANEYRDNPNSFRMRTEYLYRGWSNDDEPWIRKIFRLEEYHLPVLKSTAYDALCFKKEFFKKYRNYSDTYGEDAFARMVFEWLGQSEQFSESSWVYYDENQEQRAALIAWLERHLTYAWSTNDELSEFTSELTKMLIQCGLDSIHDSDRNLGYKAINNRFTANNINFRLIKDGALIKLIEKTTCSLADVTIQI